MEKKNVETDSHESDGMQGHSLGYSCLGNADPSSGSGTRSMAPVPFQLKSSKGIVQRDPEPVVQRGGGTHTVLRGESLWVISEQVYGHGRYWRRIGRHNPRVVRKGNLIHPGDVLALPEIEVPIQGALETVRGDAEATRDMLGDIPDDNYAAFRAELEQSQMEEDGEFLQQVDLMRRTGMTIEEMGDAQRHFMEQQAADRGLSIGELIADEVATTGYGGSTATWWTNLTPVEQADWQSRFDGAVVWLRANAPENIRDIITAAEGNSGGFVWAPVRNEELGAFGYTQNDWKLYVGQHWLEAYERGHANVYSNIAHEMGGHNEYGGSHSWDIMAEVLGDMDPAERATAGAGGNSIYSSYGYMETEIWAELREEEFVGATNSTDFPATDIPRQLRRIQRVFEPAIAEALVRSMYQRALDDDRIAEGARVIFADAIQDVFGFTP